MGYLYPDYLDKLVQCTSLDALREGVKGLGEYETMLKEVPDPLKSEEFTIHTKTLDDIMYETELKRYSLAFDQ